MTNNYGSTSGIYVVIAIELIMLGLRVIVEKHYQNPPMKKIFKTLP